MKRRDEDGWDIKEDAGRGWRRVVASPAPKRIVELDVIKQLLDAGVVTIAVGGGGIPVIVNDKGDLEGVPAVIDKDLASAMLASQVGADLFLVSTAVEQVALNFGKDNQEWVPQFTLAEVKQYLAEGGHFAEGSMAPKMRAVVQFMEAGGKEALITNPANIERAMAGETGKHVSVLAEAALDWLAEFCRAQAVETVWPAHNFPMRGKSAIQHAIHQDRESMRRIRNACERGLAQGLEEAAILDQATAAALAWRGTENKATRLQDLDNARRVLQACRAGHGEGPPGSLGPSLGA